MTVSVEWTKNCFIVMRHAILVSMEVPKIFSVRELLMKLSGILIMSFPNSLEISLLSNFNSHEANSFSDGLALILIVKCIKFIFLAILLSTCMDDSIILTLPPLSTTGSNLSELDPKDN